MTTLGRMQVPPGRAGRLWLEQRLGARSSTWGSCSTKGAILDREEQRLANRAADRAGDVAAVMRGVGDVDAACCCVIKPPRPADRLGWQNGPGRDRDGIHHWDCTRCQWSGAPGTAAEPTRLWAAPPCRRLGCRARCCGGYPSNAVATAALRVVQAESVTTHRTLRAVEQRWIPGLLTALAEVRLELEELEHAEGVRHRWAAQQRRR